jgi:serine/threonine protein kinase
MPFGETAAGPVRIGPYSIISELGRGGMGVVYLAQHIQLGRIVALKVIPSGGSATSDLEMRFLREARTVARLSHPHIVAVHDAGRDHGHAWFSMDYFEDGDLARRLRSQPFAPREAAALMHGVAEAIACSHAAGVLHRDLKPSNIMLSAGTPRVADFGLASELDSSGGLTAGNAVLGTPHYLAPEALSRGSTAQGVPSDIYALGVILHEMLTGRTPFAGASPAELPGLLARGDAPDLRLLAPQVPRDLATICAKCLEFEPARRYATAADLAEDLRRFLGGEPIKARPISSGSRLLRWARRRPALAATWALSILLAAASMTAALLVDRERQRANDEAASSKALADFLARDFLDQASVSDEPDRELKLRTAVDRAAARIPLRFAGAPLAEASIRFTLGATYRSLGEYAEAERQFRRSASLRRLHLGPGHTDTLRATAELAGALSELGRNPDAAPLIHASAAALIGALGAEHPYAIGALETEALVERRLGHMAKAEQIARNTLAVARRALGPDHELTRNALLAHAALLALLGRLDEAQEPSREAVATTERALGPHHPVTLSTRVKLAGLDVELGRAQQAEPLLRELHASLRKQLGPDHPETLRALSFLGTALYNLERYPEADATLTELVAGCQRARGLEHGATLLAMKKLALARGRNGHLDQAVEIMREAAATSARTLGPAQTAYAAALQAYGPDATSTLADGEMFADALVAAGRDGEAVPVYRQTAEALLRTQPDHWHTFFVRGQLGKALARSGQPAEAEPLLREACAGLVAHRSALPAGRRGVPKFFADQLALVCATLGHPADAAEWQARAAAPQ